MSMKHTTSQTPYSTRSLPGFPLAPSNSFSYVSLTLSLSFYSVRRDMAGTFAKPPWDALPLTICSV